VLRHLLAGERGDTVEEGLLGCPARSPIALGRPLPVGEREVPIQLRLQRRHTLVRRLAERDREDRLLVRPMEPLAAPMALWRAGLDAAMLELGDRQGPLGGMVPGTPATRAPVVGQPPYDVDGVCILGRPPPRVSHVDGGHRALRAGARSEGLGGVRLDHGRPVEPPDAFDRADVAGVLA
jgi:hypothetical protein